MEDENVEGADARVAICWLANQINCFLIKSMNVPAANSPMLVPLGGDHPPLPAEANWADDAFVQLSPAEGGAIF